MAELKELLEAAARRRPEHPAIEEPDGHSITYRELDRRAEAFRGALERAGVGTGDRVGVCAHKSIDTVAALFAILKAGAAYVPVAVDAPARRNAFIFEDCRVRAVVAEKGRVAALQGEWVGRNTALVGELGPDLALLGGPAAGDPTTALSDKLAYVLYTSGSTGKPKGVMMSERAALSFVDWCSESFAPGEDDRFSSHAPFHFDLSILDLYVCVKHAATLLLIDEELGKQAAAMAELIAGKRLTVWYSTPSVLRLLVEFGKMERHDYTSLRQVLFAGEVFPVKHLRALMRLWPKPRYFNLYGPVETNVITWYQVPAAIPEERTEPLPIGVACSHCRTRVVDEGGKAVAAGEAGELVAAGAPLMDGYWNVERQAFLLDEQGTRWYRTGDLVRHEPDGNYRFLGRRDRMVKRRGHRVELGEIEAALYRHPAVTEAAVIAIHDEESGVLIKAFVACAAESRPSILELKRFCAENLPLSMVPDRISLQASLPKTSTDKLDYQRLKEL